jgi:hypothetical protein
VFLDASVKLKVPYFYSGQISLINRPETGLASQQFLPVFAGQGLSMPDEAALMPVENDRVSAVSPWVTQQLSTKYDTKSLFFK